MFEPNENGEVKLYFSREWKCIGSYDEVIKYQRETGNSYHRCKFFRLPNNYNPIGKQLCEMDKEVGELRMRAFLKKVNVSMAQRMIRSAFEWIEENNAQYLDGIIHRSSGSQWNGDFCWRDIVNLHWQIVPLGDYVPMLHHEDCTYLFLDLNEFDHPSFLNGMENIRLLQSFSVDELNSIELVQGSHGMELFLDFGRSLLRRISLSQLKGSCNLCWKITFIGFKKKNSM